MLKEGYIPDFATGKSVDCRKPEAKVRQAYEKILYKDYFYDKDQIDIEVPVKMGTTNQKWEALESLFKLKEAFGNVTI